MIIKEITVSVQGNTEESAEEILQEFIRWLDGSGEQAFWDHCGIRDSAGANTAIVYRLEGSSYLPSVVIKEYPDN